MIRRPPRSTLTDTRSPTTTPFRSDGFGEGAEPGSAQLSAFGDGLGGIAEGADLDGKADAGGRGGLGRLGGRFRRLDGLAGDGFGRRRWLRLDRESGV